MDTAVSPSILFQTPRELLDSVSQNAGFATSLSWKTALRARITAKNKRPAGCWAVQTGERAVAMSCCGRRCAPGRAENGDAGYFPNG